MDTDTPAVGQDKTEGNTAFQAHAILTEPSEPIGYRDSHIPTVNYSVALLSEQHFFYCGMTPTAVNAAAAAMYGGSGRRQRHENVETRDGVHTLVDTYVYRTTYLDHNP